MPDIPSASRQSDRDSRPRPTGRWSTQEGIRSISEQVASGSSDVDEQIEYKTCFGVVIKRDLEPAETKPGLYSISGLRK